MVKKTQSIDGFILKRHDNASSDGAGKRAFLDSVAPVASKSAPKSTPKPVESEIRLRRAEEAAFNEDTLSADVEASLQSLETEPDQLPEPDQPSRRRGKGLKMSRRQKRKAERAKAKKSHRVRRAIKWFFIIVSIVLLATVGWLVFKALMTGGKVFQGNPFDMLTSKTRLAEDKNGRTNILIFGTAPKGWDGEDLTDSIMVVSIDQDEHNAYMISLPRDLYVKHTCGKFLGTTAGKLNETYICGYKQGGNNEDTGATALSKTAGEITGLDIQYYAHVKWQALIQLVNAVGGIDVDVKSSDKRGIYDFMTGLRLPNGPAHLDGEQALAYSRARNSHGGYGLSSGTFDRDKHQQEVLAALQQKALSAGTLANPTAVNSLLDALGDNLRTNFKTSEVQTLLDLAKNIKSNDIISLPLVNREDGEPDLVTTGMLNSISIVRPVKGVYDYSDIINYVKQNISSDPVVREAAKIDVLNGSGQSGLAQTKADDLKKDGYRIGAIATAPATISDKVKIYQLNKDKTGTASALEKRFNVKVIDGKLDGFDSKSDFVIIFGPTGD